MRRVLLVPTVCVALAVIGPASGKPNPHNQKLAPVAADTKAAQSATLRLSDLTSGWRESSTAPDSSPPDCNKNFSAYTITGNAEADFTQGDAAITSTVQIFPTRKQALGDFGVDTPFGIAACEGNALRAGFGASAKLVFAKQVDPPKVGNPAAAFAFAVQFHGITYYVNVINFVQGRAYGSLITLDPDSPLPASTLLVELMDQRMTAGAA